MGHDGKTAGIFLPNGDAQEALARSVYARAGLDPRETLYVESHGTGTVAGDNAEVRSIARVFGREAGRASDVPVGSIKTNVGHLEAASGMAGAIKAIMILKKHQIPPQLNFINPKSTLRLKERGIKVPLDLTPLTPQGHTGPRRVSVNSFGYGGTNAHAILEAYDPQPLPVNGYVNGNGHFQGNGQHVNGNGYHADESEHSFHGNGHHVNGINLDNDQGAEPKLITLSANSESSLTKVVSNLRRWLASEQAQAASLDDLAFTLNTRRSKLPWRCTVISSNFEELQEVLGDSKLHPKKSARDAVLAFIFTGQGAQWHAMGRELLIGSESREFASAIAFCNKAIKDLGCEWDLFEELSRDKESSRLGDARFSQPITTAVQIALVDLLANTYRIRPQAVCGHSSGEIAAAYAAGALTRESAMRVAFMRGICSAMAKTMNATPGGMVAVGEGEDAINTRIRQLSSGKGKVTVACVNSPESTTISGDLAAILELEAALGAASVFHRRLKVDSAYHSHHMEVVAPLYLSLLDGITHDTPREDVAFYSSVTGKRKGSGFGPSYWTSNLVSQVKFSAASQLVAQHLSDTHSTAAALLIEIGPHAALSGPLRQSLSDSNFKLASGASFKFNYASCLIRNTNAVRTILALVGKVFESGSPLRLDGGASRKEAICQRQVVSNLPPYPWDHSHKYWRESRLSKGNRLRPFPPHDLLGLLEVNSSPYEPRWRHHVSLARIPWLRDHVIEGFVIFPGAGYLVMVIEAMKQLFQLRKMSGRITNINIRDTVIAKPVVIHDDRTKGAQEVELQLIISPSRQYNGSPWEHFRIVSYDSQNDCWIDNCSGLVSWESVVAGTATLQSQADENASAQDDGLGHLTGAAAEQWLQEVQAACPNFVDAAETYREMKASGNEYGDTFQGLKEIHYGKGHATGRIVIPDIERHIPGHYMQPHTIHPSTFDSIFQLEPVCFRREGLVAPIMPTVLGEISVAVDMDSTAGSELLVAIKHFQQSRRDSAFSYCAYQKRRDGFLRPVITGTELRTQVVGEATSDPVSQKKMTYLMEWKPDVDFITQDDLMFHASGQDLVDESYESTTASKLLGNGGVFGRLYSEYPFFKSHYPQVLRYVQALVHKNPNLKILLASSETEAISRPLTDTIGKLSAHIDIKTLDASRDPIQQGYSAYSFDLIVAVFLSRAVPSIDATMAYMQKLMKPRGRLVLLETTGSSAAQDDSFCASNGLCASGDKLQDRPLISLSDWDGLLKHHGFSGTDLVVPAHKDTSHDSSTMMVTHVLPIAAETTHRHAENVNQRMLTAQVHLGFSEDVSQAALGAAICRSLCDRGIECSRQDWDTTSHGPRDITIVIDSAEHPLLMDPSLKTFERFKRLLLQGGNIIWVGFQTSPPTGDKTALKNMASGMARVLRRENPSLRLVTVDIQDPIQLGSISQRIIQMLAAIVKRSFPLPDGNGTLESEFENEYAICNGRICIPRIIPDHTLSKHIETRNPNQNTKDDASLVNCQYLDVTRPLKFDIQVPGLLKTIRFVDNDDMSGPLGVDEVQIQARAYGINFKDVLIALGQMAPGTTMTGEVAGVITAVGSDVQSWKVGDRVTAFFVTPFGNQVRVKGKHVVGIPDSVSFANAASIPLVYFTAWYCLNHVARLEKSQSVLIHAGSGGVGQSAIQLAQMTGAEVYTTVGSAAKKKLLQEQYGIPDSHIFSSHPGKFKKQILDATKGTGLDVVLNSLSGQSLRDSWDCLAPFGTFCEIGKADIVGRSQLSMAKFDKQATFASVDVYYMHRMRPEVVVRGIRDIFAMVDKGLLKPVFPVTTFDMSRMEEAFRLMAERKHMGKLVLVANEQTIVQAPMPKAPDLKLKRDATYIIGGGLGDLGKRIGCFLAEKEAGHVVALTRRDADAVAKQPAVVEVQKSISRSGGTLHIIQCDIGDEMSTRSAAEKLSELRLPPIRGVIQGATVLRDHPFEYMELAHWTDSVRPKVQGTINMHEAFCSPETTEFFVMLSSVASIVGSASQSNYAAGNAFLDAFAHAGNQSSRVVTRYSTINIGAIAGSELVNGVLEQGIDITETIGSVSFSEVLAALEYAMNPKARENHTVSQHIMHFNRDAMEAAIGPSALSDPMFDHVPSKMREGKTTNSADTKKQSVLEAVKQSRTISEAEEIVRQALLEKFIAFIGDDVADVPISTLGLDSLVSIELKNWVKHTFRTPLQISELTGAPSILALAKVIVSRMSLEFSKVNGVGSDHGNAKQESGSATVETESDMDPPSITSGVDTASNSAGHGQDCCKRYEELTVQPLPDLDDTLDYWLEANEHLFSPQQLKSIHQDFQTMRAPNSPARQILQDLYDTHRDDKTNAWFADVVTKARFLCRRAPVAPWTSIMAAQRDGPGKRHSQAERAAIITSAALSYRQAMNAGKVEPLEIGGRPECTWGWKWLFNSTRVPQLGCDKVVSYAPSPNDWNTRDHIAVLRKGRVFKVMLQDADGQDMPLHRLQAIFEAILARVEGDDLLSGLLTTDERDSWAKVRSPQHGHPHPGETYIFSYRSERLF